MIENHLWNIMDTSIAYKHRNSNSDFVNVHISTYNSSTFFLTTIFPYDNATKICAFIVSRILYALLAGTWSDQHGRKLLIGQPHRIKDDRMENSIIGRRIVHNLG